MDKFWHSILLGSWAYDAHSLTHITQPWCRAWFRNTCASLSHSLTSLSKSCSIFHNTCASIIHSLTSHKTQIATLLSNNQNQFLCTWPLYRLWDSIFAHELYMLFLISHPTTLLPLISHPLCSSHPSLRQASCFIFPSSLLLQSEILYLATRRLSLASLDLSRILVIDC